MKELTLPSGHIVAIDDEDFDRVSRFRWYITKFGYVIARPRNERSIQLHRFILGLSPSDPHVDHVDGNPLNNQKSNLRLATPRENCHNRAMRNDNSSGFKGVYWYSAKGKWRAQIKTPNGIRKSLGYYRTAEEAARAYDKAAVSTYGEFACTNFPNGRNRTVR